MIGKNAKKLCRDDISKIKNYELALADTTRIWDCHHWNEQWFTAPELQKLGRYYNVPADELVFMTHKEHWQWHKLYGAEQKERSRKLSEALKGKTHSEEAKQKMSEAHKGKNNPMSAEWRRKNSEAHKGKPKSEETKRKMSESHRGTTLSEETKQKMREAWIRRKAKRA